MGKVIKKGLLSTFTHWIFTHNVFIALCAGGWLAGTQVTIGKATGDQIGLSIGFLMLSTLIVYNLDRMFANHWSLIKRCFSDVYAIKRLPRNAHAKVIFLVFSSILDLVILIHLPLSFFEMLVFPAVLALFYAIPLLPKQIRPREVPLVKIFLIAFVWAYASIFLTMDISISIESIVALFFQRFLFIYAITIPFDLRDRWMDIDTLVTIPHRLGVKLSIASALVALAFATLVSIFMGGALAFSMITSSGLAAILIATWKENKSNSYYFFWLDGCILLQGLSLIVYSIFIK